MTEVAPEAHAQATLAPNAGGSPEAADPPLAPGAVVDRRYRVIRPIGEGGMGRVYEVEHLFIRRRLALKLVRRDAGTGEAAARLLQEAVLAGKVPHATVVPVFDCAALPDGQVYVAMELLRGESLEQALCRPLPAAELLRWLAEVARGLAAAHRAGIVHRDVKPANLFLARTAEGAVQPRILDFGIAKLLPGGGGTTEIVQTQAGSLLGTPFYMAPERARGEAGGPRSDLYSLGVILYEALTGSVPFVGETFMAIVGRHLREPPLDPRQAAPERPIPDALAELSLALLKKDPAERPADGEAVALALLGLIEREPGIGRLVVGAGARGGAASAEAATQAVAEAATRRLAGDGAATERLADGSGVLWRGDAGDGPGDSFGGRVDGPGGRAGATRQLVSGAAGELATVEDGRRDRSGAETQRLGSGAAVEDGPRGRPGAGTQRLGSGAAVEDGPKDRPGAGGPEDRSRRGAAARDSPSATLELGSGQIGGAAVAARPGVSSPDRRVRTLGLVIAAVAAAGLGGWAVRAWSGAGSSPDGGVDSSRVGATAAPGGATSREPEGVRAGGATSAAPEGARAGGATSSAPEGVQAGGATSVAPEGVQAGGPDPGVGPPGAVTVEGAGPPEPVGDRPAVGPEPAAGGEPSASARAPTRREGGKKAPRKAGTTGKAEQGPKIKIDVYDE